MNDIYWEGEEDAEWTGNAWDDIASDVAAGEDDDEYAEDEA